MQGEELIDGAVCGGAEPDVLCLDDEVFSQPLSSETQDWKDRGCTVGDPALEIKALVHSQVSPPDDWTVQNVITGFYQQSDPGPSLVSEDTVRTDKHGAGTPSSRRIVHSSRCHPTEATFFHAITQSAFERHVYTQQMSNAQSYINHSRASKTPKQRSRTNKKALYWTPEDHAKFVAGLEEFGLQKGLGPGGAALMASYMGNRTVLQVKSHFQKHLADLAKCKSTTSSGSRTAHAVLSP